MRWFFLVAIVLAASGCGHYAGSHGCGAEWIAREVVQAANTVDEVKSLRREGKIDDFQERRLMDAQANSLAVAILTCQEVGF